MKLRVAHRTHYRYAQPVTLGHNQMRLTPRDCPGQRTLRSSIFIDPAPAEMRPWRDYFENSAAYFTCAEPHLELTVSLEAAVEVWPRPWDGARTAAWDEVARALAQPTAPELVDAALFVFDSPFVKRGEELRAYAEPSFPPGRPLLAAASDLMSRIHADFTYDPQATTLATTSVEALRLRRGVCQDFAHLQIACLRSLGLAARYVSGYLVTHPPPGKPKLIGADASHAWLAVFFPGQGWLDFDPTNDCLPSDEHITLAWGRDYFDVAPIKGLYLGDGASTLEVSVDVGLLPEPEEAAPAPL